MGGGSPNTEVPRSRNLAHEIGHYLGLFHPWSGGVSVFEPIGLCNVDDGCADTPRTSVATQTRAGAPCTGLPSCLTGDDIQFPMAQNYMDYAADRCRHMFTLCQRERMRTVLESTTFRRTLWEGNDALRSVDDALLQIQNNIGFTSSGSFHLDCPNRVFFEDVEIANYGANPISSIEVQFFIGDTAHGAKRTIDFSPALASHARMTLFEYSSGNEVRIPIAADLYEGEVSLRIISVNGVADTEDDYGRNTYTVEVDRERVESGLPSLEFSVDSDGDDEINFAAGAGYDDAFSVETGSNGNKLLRIHRSLESAEDGHTSASLLSPYVSVSEILNEGGGDYALGVRLRYSYVANDLSEGDRLLLVLFDCQGESFVPYGGTDVDVATSHYPEGGEVPHERTFRDIHLPLPISRDGRVTTYDVFTTERRLRDSVQVVLLAWNGGGSDLFIENFEFTRTLNSDLPNVDFGVVGQFHDPYVCETDEVIPNVISRLRYANYGKEVGLAEVTIQDQGRGIEVFTYHESSLIGADTPYRMEGRELGSPLYEGSSLSFESKPLFVVEGFNRFLLSVEDSRAGMDTNTANNTIEYSQYYTKNDPEPLSRAGFTETFSSDNLVWVSDFVGAGEEGGWVRNSEGSYMELRFSDAVTQKDAYYRLISRRFDFSAVSDGEFIFRVAYSGTDTQNDILRVYAVRRCGVSAGALLYEKSGTALSTSTSTDVQWSPSAASDWREEVVDLTPVLGHDDIFILIVGIKGGDEGRTIHIDDLSFRGGPRRLLASETELNLLSTRGSTELVVSSNIPWVMEEDIAWLTLDKNAGTTTETVTVSYEVNSASGERNGSITLRNNDSEAVITHTINISQAGAPPRALVVTPTPLSLPPTIGSTILTVTSTDVEWLIEEDIAWLTPDQTSGTASGTVTLTYEANTTTNARDGTLTFRSSDIGSPITVVIDISQEGRRLSVSETQLNLSPTMGKVPIRVSTNIPWLIEEDIAWVTSNKTSGTASATVDFSYEANGGTEERMGVITFRSSGSGSPITVRINISQEGRTLSVSETQLNFPFTLGSTQLTVSSNIPWIIEEDIAWLTPNQTSGTATTTVNFSYEANGGTAERMGVITLRNNDSGGSITVRINISQEGRMLSVSETQLNLPFTLGITQLMVSSNIPWLIEEDIAWLTPNQTSGTATATVDFSYEANVGTSERMGVIMFKSSDGADVITHSVEVTQAGTPPVVGVPLASSQEVVLYPNPVEDGVVSLDVSPLLYSSARVRIINFSGAVAWEDTFSRLDARFLRFRPNIARGQAYILHIESGDYSQKLRLLY